MADVNNALLYFRMELHRLDSSFLLNALPMLDSQQKLFAISVIFE